MLDLGECPTCRGRDLRLASRLVEHAARLVSGTRRRYCPGCGRRWLADVEAGGVPRVVLWGGAIALAASWRYGAVARRALELRAGRAPAAASRTPAASAQAAAKEAPGETDLVSAFWRALSEERGRQQAAEAAERRERARAPIVAGTDPLAEAGGVAEMIRRLIKHASEGQLEQLDKMDKKQLWDQYGKYFGSKEEAKQAYDEYRRQRAKDLPSR